MGKEQGMKVPEGARAAIRRMLQRPRPAPCLATAAIKAGWSAKKVAAQLGHSSTAITLDM